MSDWECIRHVVIRGRVQAVGYRVFTEYAALDHDLAGWVRNRRDGSVEALACGPAAAVESLMAWARSGPDGAQVSALEVTEVPAPAEPPSDFVQRETA